MSTLARIRLAAKSVENYCHKNLRVWKLTDSSVRTRFCYLKSNFSFPLASLHRNGRVFSSVSRSISSTSSEETPPSASQEVKATGALPVLIRQAEAGNVAAQFHLGLAYLNGHHGLKPSPDEAIAWIKR